MKVILLEDIENVGKKYEIKEVKPGHARNFLIPKGLVKLATKKNLVWMEAQKELIDEKMEEDLKLVQEVASRGPPLLAGSVISGVRRANVSAAPRRDSGFHGCSLRVTMPPVGGTWNPDHLPSNR